MSFSNNVKMELFQLSRLGVKVPVRAFELASDEQEMKEYENMNTRDCADLLIMLGQIA